MSEISLKSKKAKAKNQKPSSLLAIRYWLFPTFLLLSLSLFSQKKQYTKYAEEALLSGDYYSAAYYFEKLYENDSSNNALAFKLATCYKEFNAFKKAYSLYEKVYNSPEKTTYISSLYWMAMINKYNENYEMSAAQFATYLKETNTKSDFIYQSALQESKTAKFIPLLLKDTLKYNLYSLSGINTSDAEFSSLQLNDSSLYFSALRKEEVKSGKKEKQIKKEYIIKIFEAKNTQGFWSDAQEVKHYSENKKNSANGTFNKQKNKFIYSLCNDLHSCLLVESVLSDSGWSKPQALPQQINLPGTTNTQPFLLKIDAKKEILFFSSNRSGGKGGMDIWYVDFTKNTYGTPKNIGTKINTPGNEITPFYNVHDSTFYFSSDWHAGIGGQDIFKSKGEWNALTPPTNAGIPLNSSKNDQYFTLDSIGNGFLTSTREGTLADDSNAICCTDIYRFEKIIEKKKIEIPQDTLPYVIVDAFVDVPVILYFHNDEPNPKTRDTLTSLNYLTTYHAYKKLQPDYEKIYTRGLNSDTQAIALEEIQLFFQDKVDMGVANLAKFSNDLMNYLQQGYSAEIIVKGFASPLTKSDYNVNLSLRRIASLLNYLKEFQNGIYLPYINNTAENGAKITFTKEPNGEYKSASGVSDNYHDVRNSIYNPLAAQERRIEIISVKLIPKEFKTIAYTDDFKKMIVDADTSTGENISKKIYLKNTSNEAWEIQQLGADCSCIKLKWEEGKIEPGDYLTIEFEIEIGTKLGTNRNQIFIKKSDQNDFQRIELQYNVTRKR